MEKELGRRVMVDMERRREIVLHRNRARLSGEVVTKWWTCPHGVCPHGDCWTAWDCRKHDEKAPLDPPPESMDTAMPW